MLIGGVVITRCARGTGAPRAPAWQAALAGAWLIDEHTQVLKHEGRAWVWRARLLDREVVIKSRELGAIDRLKQALGASRADRHWRGAAALSMKRIQTARVLAMGRMTIDSRPADVLVMEFIEGPTLLKMLAGGNDLGTRAQHVIARAVGRQVGVMVEAGMYNRDHKPSNILMRTTRAGDAEPVVIDCVAIRYGPWASSRRGAVRMLASLVIEPTGCGCPPRRTLMLRVLLAAIASGSTSPSCKADVRALWRAVADRVNRHGDTKPLVNPLE
jgi:tRNA A-37 threonylcarbamoyl transferase component Bud32